MHAARPSAKQRKSSPKPERSHLRCLKDNASRNERCEFRLGKVNSVWRVAAQRASQMIDYHSEANDFDW
jgi:hypothetical protein